jgi:crotonobetainyl-CoA:carnitine CoA-transferase CaiB-like acyl-CoA transferase
VLTVSEAAESRQAKARQSIIYAHDSAGRRWPLLNSPLRLKLTPPLVQHPIGKLGEANAQLKLRA